MRFTTVLAALAAATCVSAAPADEKRWQHCLTSAQAEVIVDKFLSILEGVNYHGQSPNITAKQIVAEDYVEYSDSILSLEKQPVCTILLHAGVNGLTYL